MAIKTLIAIGQWLLVFNQCYFLIILFLPPPSPLLTRLSISSRLVKCLERNRCQNVGIASSTDGSQSFLSCPMAEGWKIIQTVYRHVRFSETLMAIQSKTMQSHHHFSPQNSTKGSAFLICFLLYFTLWEIQRQTERSPYFQTLKYLHKYSWWYWLMFISSFQIYLHLSQFCHLIILLNLKNGDAILPLRRQPC